MQKDVPGGQRYDVVIVGAGMGGLYAAYRLLSLGLTVRVLEAGDGVGGTWYWNRYPGARCDVASVDYSFSFSEALQNEWDWTERYASQPELESYFNHVVDRFGLRPHIELRARVTGADYDASAAQWRLVTEEAAYRARFCIMATGPLSVAYGPKFPGMDQFQGRVYHSADWPRGGVDFSGQRVGVIGTGSTGIQMIPVIAESARHLTIFQRTPNYSVPARNRPLPADELAAIRAGYRERRRQARESKAGFPPRTPPISEKSAMEVTEQQRREVYDYMWEQGGGLAFRASFADLLTNRQANETAAEYIRQKIRETVRDPVVAETLTPRDHPYATKRPPVDTNYYQTFNRSNVTLVDLRATPVERFTERGIETSRESCELDIVIMATGFDAVTGSLAKIDIRGRSGLSLAGQWSDGPRTYLGMAATGFPNLFLVNGPGSAAPFTNMATHTEQNVEWITDLICHALRSGAASLEAREAAQDAWLDRLRECGEATLYPEAKSWYMGANIPGKPRVFLAYAGGFDTYSQECERVAADGYRTFAVEREL